jgi:DNA-binding protein H-NS
MRTPNFSKMSVDALIVARATIDNLLSQRVPRARRELEERLKALSEFANGKGRSRKLKSKPERGSKLRGRSIPPKYRGPNGETWSGRGLKPRWLSTAIKGGADLEDFALGAGGRRKKGANSKRGKKRAGAGRGSPKVTKLSRRAANAREASAPAPVADAAAS